VTDWTNVALQPPPPHVMGLFAAAAEDKAVADALVDNYNDPSAMWRAVATPQRTAAFLARIRTPLAA
jgi:hypothetical protein